MAQKCTAIAKSTGEQCQQPATGGTTKCRYHGGKSLKGAASPSFKTGRHSKHLPERMLKAYGKALDDEKLTELRGELALLDSRVLDILQRVDSGESGAAWKALHKAWNKYRRERGGVDEESAFMHLEALFDAAWHDMLAWQEIHDVIEQRRKLVDTETKRLKDLQQMMTTEKAMALLGLVVDTIRRHVTDRTALTNIHADLAGVLGTGVVGSA